MIYALCTVGILCGAIVFLVFPSRKNQEDRKNLKNAFIAHRGLHNDNFPENSLSAFENAVKNGYTIENDIHLLADGNVVVFHDDDLKRMCGADKEISKLTIEEVKQYRLKDSDQQIPTLKECLDIVDGKVPILIEFKCKSKKESYELCKKANEILSDYNGKYYIQSFYPFVLQWYKKNRPDVLRGILASGFYKEKIPLKLAGALLFNVFARPHFVSYEFKYAKNIFRRVCVLLGATPIAWTFRKPEDIKKYEKYYEAFIFEGFIPEK